MSRYKANIEISETVAMDSSRWAESLYATADFGDERLRRRAVSISVMLAANPESSIPKASSEPAEAKGAYRFLENDSVTTESLLAPVGRYTVQQCYGEQYVLAISDTTTMSFPTLKDTTGLGPVNDKSYSRGMLCHSTLIVNDRGVPLGLSDVFVWSRDERKKSSDKEQKQRPIEDKESFKWIRSKRETRKVFAALPEKERPTIVFVDDREGDVHEAFAEVVGRPKEHAVIRCRGDRRISEPEQSAYKAVEKIDKLGHQTVNVPRAKGGLPERIAQVDLYAVTVTLDPSKDKYPHRERLQLTLLWIYEPDAPEGAESIDWKLWTTLPVTTLAEGRFVMETYAKRWLIETYHRVLKQGCKIEKLQLSTAERIHKALLLYAPIAVRILYLTYLSRTNPDLPCTEVLTRDQWHGLYLRIHKKPPSQDTPVPSLRQATLWIGRLGGHLGRKGDGMPGVATLWRGWRDLEIIVATMQALRNS